MSRIIEHQEASPAAVAKDSVPGTTVYVCRCGLTRNAPLCDGSHRATRGEAPGVLYAYARDGETVTRQPVEVRPVPAPEPATLT